jgi:Icc-related predicted phosphoesterase
MRVHVVSDVHGEAVALSRAADGSDAFVCLGDLILFLDYAEPSRGIFADLFGAEFAQEYIALRTAGDYGAARRVSERAWAGIGVDRDGRWQVMQSLVREQYDELFAAMPSPAFVTPGNVDVPAMWPDFLRPGHTLVDGVAMEVGGMRWGFVGGGLVSPMRTPHELTPEEFAKKVDELGPVDVLFSHIPPAVPGLTYDVLARRFEVGSQALLDYVRREQPRYHLFGHVHQPLAARTRIGRTECVNVGHFQGGKQPFAVDL